MTSLGKRIVIWLAFTRAEQSVLFFLVGAFVLGSGLRLAQTEGGTGSGGADSSADSVFAALTDLDLGGPEADVPPLININSASKAELVALPGIGEVTAERIILHREELGPFTTVDDLLLIKGISRKKLAQLEALITIH